MRKYLLPQSGNFYKANLHSHSNLSDARLTVDEVKRIYKERGYSIIAFSDHDLLFNHYNRLREDDFLPITSYEVGINGIGEPFQYRKSLHMNLFAKNPYQVAQPFIQMSCVEWLRGIETNIITDEMVDNVEVDGIVDCEDHQLYAAKVNNIIRTANEKGFLVTLNHPNWSLLNASDCLAFEGLWAMEVYNHNCFSLNGFPDDDRVYDEILRSGKKIFATATDDNHNALPLDDPRSDSFGGFTMIKAKSLDYSSVIKALEQGNFYASQGPEIKELYFEDGKIHIECSEAREICLNCLTRQCLRIGSKDCDITSADFEISDSLHGYVRFKVIDKHGKAAWTNPYYVKDLMEVKDTRVAIV